MHRTQRCFLASGCSTYRKYALRAPRVENSTGHGTSPPSRRNPVRYAGYDHGEIMTRLTSYEGLTALVTGASSGIGRLLALRMAAAGARVALVARRERELEELADKIRAGGGEAVPLVCDVADRQQALATAEKAAKALGRIDVLVNNAGYGHHRRFLDWELDDMERVMRVNFLGTLYFTKALLPAMVERGTGWLVFIASAAGRIAPADETAYAASKHAMVGLAGSLSLEVEGAGVHVLTVCPGAIRTPFFDDEALARLPAVARRQMAEPEALVEAIMDALARGKRELTFPRWIASGYVAQALAPAFFRGQLKKHTVKDD
jgi:short-subunit dehydrogenase